MTTMAATAGDSEEHQHHPRTSLRLLVWGALGVVFGDIGTSPLYAMSETVSSHLLATRRIEGKGHDDLRRPLRS